MATRKAKPAGRSLTTAERHANGLRLVQGLWLPAELVERLDATCKAQGCTRTDVIRALLGRLPLSH